MSILKFQTSIVNGKPQIFFEKERVVPPTYKFSKLNRDQRFPVKDRISAADQNPEVNHKAQPTPTPKPADPYHRKCVETNDPPQQQKKVAKVAPRPAAPVKSIMKQGGSKPGTVSGNSVTLTQDQLSAILNSVTQAANAKSNVRISIDTKDNYVNIDAESPRHRKSQRQRFDVENGSDSSDTPQTRNKTNAKRTGPLSDSQALKNAAKSKAIRSDTHKQKGESLLGLLGKVETDNNKKAHSKDRSNSKPVREEFKGGGSNSSTIETLMQRVIQDNKDKLTEDELVDLLAEVYIEAKRKGLTNDSESTPHSADMNAKHRPQRRRSESRASSTYSSEDDEYSRGRRHRSRGREQSKDARDKSLRDSNQSKSTTDHLKAEARKRTVGDVSGNKTAQVLTDSSNKENGHTEKRSALPPPQPLTKVEKKRLQWEEERKIMAKQKHAEDEDEAKKRTSKKTSNNRQIKSPDENSDSEQRNRKSKNYNKSSRSHSRTRRRRTPSDEDSYYSEPENLPTGKSKRSVKVEAEMDKEASAQQLHLPLSKVEAKKLQWEKERQEISKLQYDPWGRPGAGAPPLEYSVGAIELSPRGAEKWDSSQYGALSPRESYSRRPGSDQPLDSVRESGPVDNRGAESDGNLNSSFTRGRGLASLDDVARKDIDLKKKKQMEHQEAIRLQVEEQKRMKALERERRIREEIEEEQRLAKEREKMQHQYDDEKNRMIRKEEDQSRRLAALKETLDAAEEAARLDKHRKRLARLEMGGHNTSNLRTSIEAQMTSRSNMNNTNHPYSQCSSPAIELKDIGNDSDWASPRYRAPPDPIVTDFRTATSQLGGTFDLGHRSDHVMKNECVQTDPSLIETLNFESQRNNSFRLDNGSLSGAGGTNREQHLHQTNRFHLQGISEDGPASYRHPDSRLNQTYQLDDSKRTQNPHASNRPSRKTSYMEKTRQEWKKNRQPPGNIHKRPEWNSKNPNKKKVISQSERDPFFVEKEKERQERRIVREAALLAKVQANADLIPTNNLPPSDRFHRKKHPLPAGGYLDLDTKRNETRNRQRSYSPPTARQTIQDNRYGHSSAPPTPPYGSTRFDYGTEGYTNRDIPPLVRTTDVLNPALADEPLPLSREASYRKRDTARKAYMKNLNPAQFGSYMENRDDRYADSILPAKSTKDPIFNPGVVRDRPTPRQTIILQQLSDIRQGLLQRQKEIETSLSMTEGIA